LAHFSEAPLAALSVAKVSGEELLQEEASIRAAVILEMEALVIRDN
jgi:hypothetical protein